MKKAFKVIALFDPEAKVWYVEDSDVPGLATEADTIDSLLAKLSIMIPEMLELNAHHLDDGLQQDVPIELLVKYNERSKLVT